MNAGDITTAIKNSIRAISKGEFLLRLRADKLYLHILYLFVLAWLSIMLSLKVDKKLTKEGEQKAKRIYERHTVLTKLFIGLGVGEETAADDACRIEHYISDETFEAVKAHMAKYGSKLPEE